MRLTNKNQPFLWTIEEEWAFEELKRRLTSAPLLTHFDPSEQVDIHTVASAGGVGAIFIQTNGEMEQVVAYDGTVIC